MELTIALLEVCYQKKMKKKHNLENMSKFELRMFLYPNEWMYITNDNLKVEILSEAIEKECFLIETDAFDKYMRR